MDSEKIVEAVHRLEMCVTKQLGEQKELLVVQNDRLTHLRIAVDRHREILFGNDEGTGMGLVSKMHTIEGDETERRMTVRGLALALITALGKIFYDFFNV